MYSFYGEHIARLLLYDQVYVRHRRCSLGTMEPDKIVYARACVCTWNRSRGLILDILSVGLDRVTRGTECKKALYVGWRAFHHVGSSGPRREIWGMRTLWRSAEIDQIERRAMRETNEDVTFRSYLPLFLFCVPQSKLRYCVLFSE